MMKRLQISVALLLFGFTATTIGGGGTSLHATRLNEVLPFNRGEQLDYNIRYGFVKAGEARLSVTELATRNGKSVYHMVGTGRTTGMTDWFFRTRDRYETFVDSETLLPVEFIRDIDEGGYKLKRHIFFNQNDKTAYDAELRKDTIFKFQREIQDIFSAFYYARSLDLTGIKVNDVVKIDVFLDHEHFPFNLKYLGKNKVEVGDMEINCLKFMPVVQQGRVFKDKETMTIWVSDDANRIPVRLESELAVGSIKVDLMKYEDLTHPLNRVK